MKKKHGLDLQSIRIYDMTGTGGEQGPFIREAMYEARQHYKVHYGDMALWPSMQCYQPDSHFADDLHDGWGISLAIHSVHSF